MNDIAAPIAPLKRRRWPLYLLAAFALLAAFVAAAPSMLGGLVARGVSSSFTDTRHGKLEIASLELAWTSRQALRGARLLDPDGREVAALDVELPSLLDLAGSGGTKLGKVLVRARADLSAADDGTTNLQRALEPRVETEEKAPDETESASTNLAETLRALDLELDVAVERVAWSDARTRATGKPFAIEGLTASIVARPGEPLRVRMDGVLAGDEPGKLALSAALHDLLDARGLNDAARFELEADLDAIPSALVDALAQQPGLVEAALGPRFRVDARGDGTLQSGTLDLAVLGDRGKVEFGGSLAGGVLTGTREAALAVDLQPDPAVLGRFLAALLPEGLAVESSGAPRIAIELRDLRVDVSRVLAAVESGADVVPQTVSASEMLLRVSSSSWRASGAKVPLERGVALDSPRLDMRLAPDGDARKLEIQFDGSLSGGASGSLAFQARCGDAAKLLAADLAAIADSLSGDEPPFEATLIAQGVGTAVVAAFAPADVPAAELLGPSLDVRVEAANRGGKRECVVSAKAAHFSAEIGAWMDRGALVSPSGREWTVKLTPPSAALAKTLLPYLPAGLSVEPGKSIELRVGPGVRVPLRELGESTDVAATLLRGAELDLGARIDSLSLTTAKDGAKPQRLDLRELELKTHLGHAAGAAPLRVEFGGSLEGGAVSLRATCPTENALANSSDFLALPALDVELDAKKLPLRTIEAFALDGADLRLGDEANVRATAHVTQDAKAQLGAHVDAEFALARTTTKLAFDAIVEDPLQRLSKRPSGALPQVSAKFRIDGLRPIEGFLSPELAATMLELLGDSVQGELANAPAAGSKGVEDTRLSARIDAARVAVALDARVAGGALAIASEPLRVSVKPTASMIDRYIGANLPEGAKLAFADAEPVFAVSVSEAQVPLDAWLVAEGATPRPVADALREAKAKLRVDVPRLTYTQPAADGKSPGTPIALEGLGVDAELVPKSPATANLRGKISGAKSGDIGVRATVADVGAFAASGENAPQPVIDLVGDLRGIPTALVDALAAQDGLLVDVLGAEMNLTMRGRYPSDVDPLRAEMTSPTSKVELVGRFETGQLVAKGDQGLDANVPLSPLLSERVVGKLVPLLVHAKKPEGSAPIAIAFDEFTLPLGGDLRGLNGVALLDLGEVTYELLPGLSGALSSFGLGGAGEQRMKLDALTVPIVKGVAGYEALPVSISGKKYLWKGKYDLVTSEFALGTEVPLSQLGKKVSKELDKVREFLDPNLKVPLELKGTWSKPKLSISDKFLEKVLEDAAKGALEGGLIDLLGGKKKKKE